MRVKVEEKVIPASFLKIEGRGTLALAKDRRKRGRKKNWLVIRTQDLKELPGARKGERRGSKGDVRGGATARGTMWKSGYVRVIEGKEAIGEYPIEYFFP